MSKSGTKPKRRHRADLSGYTLKVAGMADPPAPDVIYKALYAEFLAWRRRVREANGEARGITE